MNDWSASSTSWTRVAVQAASLIVPVCAFAVVEARVKDSEPKFESGSCSHRPAELHAEGASATHSADERSGAAICKVFVKVVGTVGSEPPTTYPAQFELNLR
jgi:hypothetical protein